jgi:hypothetical protein
LWDIETNFLCYVIHISTINDQIADLIDLYFGTAIEDTTNIHRLVDEELVVAMRRQARENELENINGGSK